MNTSTTSYSFRPTIDEPFENGLEQARASYFDGVRKPRKVVQELRGTQASS